MSLRGDTCPRLWCCPMGLSQVFASSQNGATNKTLCGSSNGKFDTLVKSDIYWGGGRCALEVDFQSIVVS